MSSRISFNFSSSPSFWAVTSLQQNISIIILNHSYNLLEPTHDGNMQHSTHTLTLESIYIKIGHSRRCTFKKLLLLVNEEVRLRGLPKYDARNSRFCMPSYAVNFPILNCIDSVSQSHMIFIFFNQSSHCLSLMYLPCLTYDIPVFPFMINLQCYFLIHLDSLLPYQPLHTPHLIHY